MRLSIQLVRVSVALSAAAGALALAAACSSSETAKTPAAEADAAVDAPVLEPVEPAETAPPKCTLAKAGSTGVKACDDCLEKSCCTVIETCFADAPCSALNDCINDCGAKYGRGDAGAQCVRGCTKGKDEATTKLYDVLDCQSTRCLADCKQ